MNVASAASGAQMNPMATKAVPKALKNFDIMESADGRHHARGEVVDHLATADHLDCSRIVLAGPVVRLGDRVGLGRHLRERTIVTLGVEAVEVVHRRGWNR